MGAIGRKGELSMFGTVQMMVRQLSIGYPLNLAMP